MYTYEEYLNDYGSSLLDEGEEFRILIFPESVLMASEEEAKEWVREQVLQMREYEADEEDL